jgi:tetratricopeptide (TPR) repeat protein
LSICTNRTCKKQGSEGIHRFAVDLALPGLEVVTCGCLARCGAGPNVALQALLPPSSSSSSSPLASAAADDADPEVIRHVGTPAALVSVLKARWRPPAAAPNDDPRWPAPLSERHLAAVRARLAGNAAAVEGDFEGAMRRYGEALAAIGGAAEGEEDEEGDDPPPALGAHLVRSNMSAALLSKGRGEEAAAVAARAERSAPSGFCTATIRLVDALYSLGRFEEAGEAARRGLAAHPGLKDRPEWRDIKGALAQKGVRV